MAVRIRKLAREVERSPEELLGVLHALGFSRYRSADDMLTPDVEAKLRRGLQRGIRPTEPLPAPLAAPRTLDAAGEAGRDLMAALVPGVVPVGGRPAPTPARPRPPAPPAAPPAVAPPAAAPARAQAPLVPVEVEDPAVLSTERAALDSLRRALASERSVVEAERAQVDADAARVAARERSLASQHEALRELQAGLERERAALDAERVALAELRSRSAASASTGLEDLLEARGLRGMDEYERALVALAQQRVLRDVLWTLRVDAPDHLRRLLDDRLVLVAGQAPEAVTRNAAVVQVAPERAEVPDAARHDAWLTRVGERLLLRGVRRLLVVGGKPRWQRLLRHGIDPRIEVRVAPPGLRTPDLVGEDVRWADAIVLWGADVGEDALAVYGAARPLLLRTEAPTWASFLHDFTTDLDR